MKSRICRNSKRGVTPAIATMVLISSTIVMALAVGAYTYGILGSNYAAITFTLTSAELFSGSTTDNISWLATSSFSVYLKNPGPAATVTSVVMTGAALNSELASWSVTPTPQPGNSLLVGGHNALPGGTVIELTMYPVHSPLVFTISGQLYEYVISFSTGQSISGSIIAQ
jgi:hypothetical protein